jgi:hypothetical protein
MITVGQVLPAGLRALLAHDEAAKLERLMVSQLEQQRLAVALLAGEAWERVLGLLRQPASSTSKGLRQQGTWHGYGGPRPPRASHGGCQPPRAA